MAIECSSNVAATLLSIEYVSYHHNRIPSLVVSFILTTHSHYSRMDWAEIACSSSWSPMARPPGRWRLVARSTRPRAPPNTR